MSTIGVAPMVILSAVYCLMGIAVLLGTVFWIWMLIDCLKHEPSGSNDKIIWVLVIVFLHAIGAIIYFFMRRQPRTRLGQPYNIP
ncbi:PLDc N-terminal domain-containing protein [Dictyobacter kobayashii]|uniref:Cardiolipin synthase N-terminal domain-containing protein n=1 Tax=Dictyobacter kobayashii TaxID=2014872 RepID=A0A402AJH3_9CHLR|nr:PLD nuclease N-terminal domain-containing protein [Dictyobacter kobayashii]GCE19328.1 hypothetical protein KDK_31280 [Dictyobacter kobayashii]